MSDFQLDLPEGQDLHARRSSASSKLQLDDHEPSATHERIASVASPQRRRARNPALVNRNLPRVCGRVQVLHTHPLFGSKQLSRWAVLDPAMASLHLWERPPPEDQEVFKQLHEAASSRSELSEESRGSWLTMGSLFSKSKEPENKRKTYSLQLLTRVDTNVHHHNILLRFSNDPTVLCLTFSNEAYDEWMETLQKYSPEIGS